LHRLDFLTVNAPGSVDSVALDLSAEGEDVAGFGVEDDVLSVDGALDAAGLIRSLLLNLD